ncbi:lipid-A-disaccharide synthase [Flexithrix dorotheae]|uniref:lipid-A-disaccharide synthase n=1 Tax=Flexithrix dorotheae TaxID=70993 RepID=UPI000373EDDF|nr:lipid-A-disaccharide synthase [Flexithrix dorotheae]
MKYYIIAGEKSGDLHASNLINEIKKCDAEAKFRGWGGDNMQKSGLELVRHYKDTAIMGFLEVLFNFRKLLGFIKQCKRDIASYQPDVVILVDYAGFNLRIASFTKKNNIKTYYYISPKVWAWNQKRAYKVKRLVDKMFVILHFEKAFYKKYGLEVDYVGNPLFDEISKFKPDAQFLEKYNFSEKPILAILPGSRFQEVKLILENMLRVIDDFPNYQFVIAGVSSLPEELYASAKEKNIKILFEETYNLLSVAKSAVVTSGTATLETALFNVPQVVCYKTSNITYQVVKRLIKVPYISLVNLIANKKVVTELIQHDFTYEKLKTEIQNLDKNRKMIIEDYQNLKEMVGTEGASKTTATLMWKYLNE